MSEEPELPAFVHKIIMDVTTFSPRVDWSRWRIAISPTEYEELRNYYVAKGDDKFYHMLRGFRFYVEPDPHNADIIMEFTHAPK